MNNQNELIINTMRNLESYIKSVIQGKLDKEHIELWGEIKIQEIHSVIKLLKGETK